jgi:acetyltransferase-like isoleucine patch superfamily enzyme
MKKFFTFIFGSDSRIFLYLLLIKRATFASLVVNFIFQRVLRRNSKFPHSINFTSNIIGDKFSFNRDITTLVSFCVSGHCYFQSLNGIVVGKNFLFAPGVKMISSNHDLSEARTSIPANPIVLGDNCWLGANSIILPGVKLGNNCVVGAGSVVTKSFEENNLVIAGNPARIINRLI